MSAIQYRRRLLVLQLTAGGVETHRSILHETESKLNNMVDIDIGNTYSLLCLYW